MLTIILGNLGSGKTLFLTYLARKIQDKQIYSNFEIKHKNYNQLKAIDLINLPDNVEVFLDEGYTWLESRISSSLLNRYMSYLLLQSRKRGTNFYITAQLFSSIDKRYRQHSDVIITAEKLINNKGFKYNIFNKLSWKTNSFIFPYEKAQKYFKYYDTNEIIQPFDNSKLEYNIIKSDNKVLIKTAEKIAKVIKNTLKGKRITHNTVKLAIMKKGLDKAFEPIVYTILKDKIGE